MGQKIRFDCDDALNVKQLSGLYQIAKRFSKEDIRVNSDPTNIKVYVGDHYKELFRCWIDLAGENKLVERDLAPEGEEADWVVSTMLEATLALLPDGFVRQL